MAAETDVFRQFRENSFRGIEFPAAGDRQFSFVHDQQKHRFIFRDDELVESIGRQNPTFSYEIPFREGVARGPWKNLFTTVYPRFLKACFDRSAGILIDYVHGPQRVKCASFRESLNRQQGADGVTVLVDFVLAPASADVEIELGTAIQNIAGAKETAGSLDRNLASGELDQATKDQLADFNKDPGRGKTNLLDVPHVIGSQVLLQHQQITAQLQDAAFRINRASDTIEAASDISFAEERQALRSLQLAAFRSADKVTPVRSSRPDNVRVVSSNTTVSSLAAQYGLSVQAFIVLNPQLTSSPRVKQGTRIRIPARARA